MDAFFASVEAALARMSAKSALAEALGQFLYGARREADNNRTENALRAVAPSKRNCTFTGSNVGGEGATTVYKPQYPTCREPTTSELAPTSEHRGQVGSPDLRTSRTAIVQRRHVTFTHDPHRTHLESWLHPDWTPRPYR